jgi:antitoxin (DNA-binding transcriptional repressor) of toxin-antitoxin stability system
VKSINLATAHRPLADYASDLGKEIVVLTRGDRPVAAIVPLQNIDRESLVLSQHPEFLRIIARSRVELAAGRKMTLKQMKRAVLPKRAARKAVRRKSRRS